MIYAYVKQNYDITDEDKRATLGLLRQLLLIGQEVRLNGLLALDEQIPTYENPFLRKAVTLAVDSVATEEIEEILDKYIILDNHTGGEVFELLLIKEWVGLMLSGTNPKQVCAKLSPLFGRDLMDELENYIDDGMAFDAEWQRLNRIAAERAAAEEAEAEMEEAEMPEVREVKKATVVATVLEDDYESNLNSNWRNR